MAGPPVVEQTKYEADYRAWRETQQGLISDVLSIVGVWPLAEERRRSAPTRPSDRSSSQQPRRVARGCFDVTAR